MCIGTTLFYECCGFVSRLYLFRCATGINNHEARLDCYPTRPHRVRGAIRVIPASQPCRGCLADQIGRSQQEGRVRQHHEERAKAVLEYFNGERDDPSLSPTPQHHADANAFLDALGDAMWPDWLNEEPILEPFRDIPMSWSGFRALHYNDNERNCAKEMSLSIICDEYERYLRGYDHLEGHPHYRSNILRGRRFLALRPLIEAGARKRFEFQLSASPASADVPSFRRWFIQYETPQHILPNDTHDIYIGFLVRYEAFLRWSGSVGDADQFMNFRLARLRAFDECLCRSQSDVGFLPLFDSLQPSHLLWNSHPLWPNELRNMLFDIQENVEDFNRQMGQPLTSSTPDWPSADQWRDIIFSG